MSNTNLPGKSNKRGRPRTFDKQAALNAALKVFWKYGYEQTTIKQLTTAMGIASPSIYCAFGNKCDLFLTALKFYRHAYWHPMFERFQANKDVYQAIDNFFIEAADILLKPCAPCGCLAIHTSMTLSMGETKIKKAVMEMRSDTRERVAGKLREGIQNSQLPPDLNVSKLTNILVNFFEGLSLQANSGISPQELREIASGGIRLMPPKNQT